MIDRVSALQQAIKGVASERDCAYESSGALVIQSCRKNVIVSRSAMFPGVEAY